MKSFDRFKVTAPTRVDFAGGTLDLWPLYAISGKSRTLNAAIDLGAEVTFQAWEHSTCKFEVQNEDGVPFLFYEPLSGDAVFRVPPSVRFPVYVISQYLAAKSPLPKWHVRVSIKTTAPLKSGLGGSSTLCVALARGMSRLFGDFVEQGWQWKLLEWVRDVEAAFLRVPTGTQDYLAALFGGVRCYTSQLGGISEESYSASLVEELRKRVIVIFSGEQHHSGISNWDIYKKAVEGDRAVLNGLEGIRRVAEELHQEFRSSGISWNRVGKCFDEEWRIRRETFQVHTPGLDEIISYLRTVGVLGTKVCGAAQGGSLIALIEPNQKDEVEKKLLKKEIQLLKTSFTPEGVCLHTLAN